MTVSFLAQIAPEGGKWKFAVVEHENETRDLFVRISSYFAKLISNIKITIFWTKKIENRLLTATVTLFSAFIWSNLEWSDLLKSKLDIYNLDPRQFYFRWSLMPMTLQPIKKPKKIENFGFLPPLWRHLKLKNNQIGGEMHCRSYILSSSQKSSL